MLCLKLTYRIIIMGEKIADWVLHHVNTSYERTAERSLRAVSNWKTDGDVEHYGAAFGTMIIEQDMNDPNAKSGTCTWQGECFLPTGDRLMGAHEGTWEALGGNIWKISLKGWDSLDGNIRLEGEISLAELTFKGASYRA